MVLSIVKALRDSLTAHCRLLASLVITALAPCMQQPPTRNPELPNFLPSHIKIDHQANVPTGADLLQSRRTGGSRPRTALADLVLALDLITRNLQYLTARESRSNYRCTTPPQIIHEERSWSARGSEGTLSTVSTSASGGFPSGPLCSKKPTLAPLCNRRGNSSLTRPSSSTTTFLPYAPLCQ